MDYPTRALIQIRKALNIEIEESDKDYFEREKFSEEDVRNWIELHIRDFLYKYINDNDIEIILR